MLLIISVLFPVIGGLILPLFNKMQNRKIKLSFVVLIQAISTFLGLMIIFGGNVSTGTFTFAPELSIGFTADSLAKFFIAMAMCAIGLNTNVVNLVKKGGKPIFMGFCCWIAIAGVSLLMQHFLGYW